MHTPMKRRSLIAAMAAIALMTQTTNTWSQTIPPLGNNKVTITFYNYNLASAGLGADATKELIREFMVANPGVTVEGVAVPSGDMTTRLQADLAAGRTPDLAQLVFND